MNGLVTGASGFVGSALLPARLEANQSVARVTRGEAGYNPPEGVSIEEGDLLEPSTPVVAFEGVDVGHYSVNSMQAGRAFAERDRRAAENSERATSEPGGRHTAREPGREPPTVPVPALSPASSRHWADLLADGPKSVGRSQLYRRKNALAVTEDRIRDLVPIELSPFDEAVATALEA